jgi:hypothetical protein
MVKVDFGPGTAIFRLYSWTKETAWMNADAGEGCHGNQECASYQIPISCAVHLIMLQSDRRLVNIPHQHLRAHIQPCCSPTQPTSCFTKLNLPLGPYAIEMLRTILMLLDESGQGLHRDVSELEYIKVSICGKLIPHQTCSSSSQPPF